MNKIIPVFYAEYGRYINRFRAIPFYIDALKPVERRILLSLHETAKGPKKVKSAKVVGYCMGNYHPHGDLSIYGTLVNMVNQSYAVGKGNWGTPKLEGYSSAAASRYTEVCLSDWVEKLCFNTIDYVPTQEFEWELEPLFLASPIPIGLIGEGVITGISFYRTLIPKYKISDLAKRLSWLLTKSKAGEKGPEIKPNIKNCQLEEPGDDQFYNLLTKGIASIIVIPFGKIDKKSIKISGRVPNSTFNSLIRNADDIGISITDLSGSELDIEVELKKRGMDLTETAKLLWNNYLTKTLNFNCLFCDNDGKVKPMGIDEILINGYNIWKYCIISKLVEDYSTIVDKKFEFTVIPIIRYIIEQFKVNKISEVLEHYRKLCNGQLINMEIDIYNLEKEQWEKEVRTIKEEDIAKVCNKRSIKNLIEMNIDMQNVDQELKLAKSNIDLCDNNCINLIKGLESVNN